MNRVRRDVCLSIFTCPKARTNALGAIVTCSQPGAFALPSLLVASAPRFAFYNAANEVALPLSYTFGQA